MKLYDYLRLSDELQYQTIWEIGKHIETLQQDGKTYLLYAINDFFVEVIYCDRTNSILSKNQFKQGEPLDKYLNDNFNL